ncbi:MAG: ATP-dependent sacrificial sulfur transferase LarE [Planctomycetota bacterium]|jgi:uncharacterized protein
MSDMPKNMAADLQAKVGVCAARLAELGSVAVAASGGVDSSFLLALAARTLGTEKVLAVTARGAFYPPDEVTDAAEVAAGAGVQHVIVESDVLADPTVAANPPDRCYHCKKLIFAAVKRLAAQRGLAGVASGDNADDPSDHRPGLRAIRELDIATPLLDAGLTKADIRAASAAMGLLTADKPSGACLASRVPYGRPLTPEGLDRIDAGEKALREMGFRQCRLRDHDPVARIEVVPEQLNQALGMRESILAALKPLGYTYVTIDLEGFRSGAMNETL